MMGMLFDYVRSKVPFPARLHGYPARYYKVSAAVASVVAQRILHKLVDEAMEGMDLEPFFAAEEAEVKAFNKRWKSEGP